MASNPAMTRIDRAERHRRIVAAYAAGLPSRAVAEHFGLTDSHVRSIARLYGVSRPVGRPSSNDNSKGGAGQSNKRRVDFK